MHCATLAILSSLSLLVSGSPHSRRATKDSSFHVYAYGEGIGGLQMFSSGGTAYLGDHERLNSTEAAPVVFTSDSSNAWMGSPNTTASSSPTWSNLTFAVPGPSSSSHEVGFVAGANNTSSLVTSGFIFYGHFVMVEGSSGAWQTLWYGLPSETDGVYTLNWNATGDDSSGKVLLTLRDVPPTNSGSSSSSSSGGSSSGSSGSSGNTGSSANRTSTPTSITSSASARNTTIAGTHYSAHY